MIAAEEGQDYGCVNRKPHNLYVMLLRETLGLFRDASLRGRA
jgi:hypothetical protein